MGQYRQPMIKSNRVHEMQKHTEGYRAAGLSYALYGVPTV